jgi:hypothetical protein
MDNVQELFSKSLAVLAGDLSGVVHSQMLQ